MLPKPALLITTIVSPGKVVVELTSTAIPLLSHRHRTPQRPDRYSRNHGNRRVILPILAPDGDGGRFGRIEAETHTLRARRLPGGRLRHCSAPLGEWRVYTPARGKGARKAGHFRVGRLNGDDRGDNVGARRGAETTEDAVEVSGAVPSRGDLGRYR